MIVVDTSAWSRALRRSGSPQPAAILLDTLIRDGEPVALPGIVLQELLSGLRTPEAATRLARVLEPFPLLLADREHHLLAAEIANRCRARGVATTTPDTLIAATTMLAGGTLLTWDADFAHIAAVVPVHVRLERDG